MLNLTYNNYNACESVRLACTNGIPTTNNTAIKNNKNKKSKMNIGENKTHNKDTVMDSSATLGGLALLLSLLNIQFAEDMFDIHQHVIGLLINVVCILKLYRWC
jgi:hypothetical protein